MDERLFDVARRALEESGSASAVIFVVDQSGRLSLAAVAGLDGEPLQRLVDAVKSPDHPIVRTARTGHAEFDVTPMAPGGPALRSHVPVHAQERTIGVVALAHQASLNAEQKQALLALADEAAGLFAS